MLLILYAFPIQDPCRPGVKNAVDLCKIAGVKVCISCLYELRCTMFLLKSFQTLADFSLAYICFWRAVLVTTAS